MPDLMLRLQKMALELFKRAIAENWTIDNYMSERCRVWENEMFDSLSLRDKAEVVGYIFALGDAYATIERHNNP